MVQLKIMVQLTILLGLAQPMLSAAVPAQSLLSQAAELRQQEIPRCDPCSLPRSVVSYEFTSRQYNFTSGESPGEIPEVCAHFQQSGDMFRVNVLKCGEAGAQSDIVAYDGKRYQLYTEFSETLSFSKYNRFPDPYYETNPVAQLFLWHAGSPDVRWHQLRDRWNPAAEVEWLPEEEVNGQSCCHFRVDTQISGQARWDVYTAPQYGCLPMRIRVQALGEGAELSAGGQIDVLSVREIELGDEPSIYWPMTVRMEELDAAGQPDEVTLWETDPESLKVNHHISIDVFTLSPTIAQHVDDYDRRSVEMGQLASRKRTTTIPRAAQSSLGYTFVLCNIVCLCLIVCGVWWFTGRNQ